MSAIGVGRSRGLYDIPEDVGCFHFGSSYGQNLASNRHKCLVLEVKYLLSRVSEHKPATSNRTHDTAIARPTRERHATYMDLLVFSTRKGNWSTRIL